MPIQDWAEGVITLTDTKPDTFERMRNVLAEFGAKYDYMLNYDDRVSITRYEVKRGLLVFSKRPKSGQLPFAISAVRRPNGSVVVSYEDGYSAVPKANPVADELKQLIIRHMRREHVSYSREPARWHLAPIGGN
jgi:hypothetical protein